MRCIWRCIFYKIYSFDRSDKLVQCTRTMRETRYEAHEFPQVRLHSFHTLSNQKYLRDFKNMQSYKKMNFFVDYSAFSNRSYWSSGYDKEGPGKYRWCTDNNSDVADMNWKDGAAPSTAGCVKVTYPIIPKPTKPTRKK